MGTVTVLTADRVIQYENQDLVGGSVDVNGDLILQKRDGTTINLGNIKDHGQLTGLSDDDHPQYAKADGSRGAFASTAQGARADAARKNTQAVVAFQAGDSTSVVEQVTIIGDGTSTSNWVNRLEYLFRDTLGNPDRRTFVLNEYGEIRVAPGQDNTVALRAFVKEFPNNPQTARSTTVPVVELMDDRTNRTSLRGWLGDGTLVRKGIKMSECLVLATGAAVPAGTPANTVIVRY